MKKLEYTVIKENVDGSKLIERVQKFDGGKRTKKIQYDLFCDGPSLKKAILAATGPALDTFWGWYFRGRDLAARSENAEATAVKTTIIRKKKIDIDLAKLPLAKQVGIFNRAMLDVADFGGNVPGAVRYMAELLVEAGKAHFTNGGTVLVAGPEKK